ncbi:sulfurtransferase [Halomonas sp. KAO]|uniref:sulfurtransferase n=1 Tax=unclassified Halomonas TaxID=2609666 RepID=UPI0018A102BA|nr:MULTISPECIES: sulfurtransferase [unclassified Halomonas]MBF7053040.1 sulfurtransferase [Halomonas sp. KAO]MDT0500660.1 sulfurtransferase [Halomonas sp. PAR7]MDT0513149.1 sulfurtransferase [Halomonas sp. LES1]MDT0591440.1 sulfurtransferase [Halomonas sp. PAR8]
MRTRLLIAAGTLAMAGNAHAQHPSPLVDAEWLSDQLDNDDLVVLDVRSSIDNGGDRASFEEARIPGSRYSNYTDAGWRESRDGVAGLMPEIEALETLIGELGIDNDDTVIVVSAGTGATDFGSAARVYWTFKALGHDEVAVLNGGFAGWQAQDFEVASGTYDAPEATTFEASLQEALLATTEEVEAAIEAGEALVDARPEDFYTGRTQSPAARAPGTIPGAVNLPHHAALVERDGAYYLEPERLKANIEALGLDPEAPTVAFCNTGHWAASGWFQLSEVGGLENVSMYDGSMAEWTQDDARPLQLAERGTITVGEAVD